MGKGSSSALLLHLAASVYAAAPALNDVLTATANLSSFQGILKTQYPELLTALEAYDANTNPITILGPSNAAFDKIPYYDVIGPAWASKNATQIENILNYQLIPGNHDSKSLNSSFQFLETQLQGGGIANVTGGQRIGAVLQPGAQPQVVFISGESSRSIVTQADIAFAGG